MWAETVARPMYFRSTRAATDHVSFSEALEQGLAADGGLFVPEVWPQCPVRELVGLGLAETGARLLQPFLVGDPLADKLHEIVVQAFDFPAPVRSIQTAAGRASVLELFHGPSAAFKDFGARFLAACLSHGAPTNDSNSLHILVATSGDTGGAVAAALHRQSGVRVTILFPKGRVSPTQERQLTCWGANVQSFAVEGTFDDCQRLVKAAFRDPTIRARHRLSSANSINLARLLPQTVYYARASVDHWQRTGESLNVIVPSGNLGNAVAGLWARHMGLPIGQVLLAHNANRAVVDYLSEGQWRPRPSVATLASAMDVGDPSNMERLRDLWPDLTALRNDVRAVSVEDSSIRERIRADYATAGQIWCPHTAVAAEAWARLPEAERHAGRWCLVATASPAKFPEIVAPLVKAPIPVPKALAAILERPTRSKTLAPTIEALRGALDDAMDDDGREAHR